MDGNWFLENLKELKYNVTTSDDDDWLHQPEEYITEMTVYCTNDAFIHTLLNYCDTNCKETKSCVCFRRGKNDTIVFVKFQQPCIPALMWGDFTISFIPYDFDKYVTNLMNDENSLCCYCYIDGFHRGVPVGKHFLHRKTCFIYGPDGTLIRKEEHFKVQRRTILKRKMSSAPTSLK